MTPADSHHNSREQDVRKRLRKLQILEKDIQEYFVLSSGPGGQNVNKVATCVVLKHVPTGIQIKCQEGRTQRYNRIRARELLAERFEAYRQQVIAAERQAREKLRRQKRKRSRRSKERMLENKRRQSDKKISRRKVRLDKPGRYD